MKAGLAGLGALMVPGLVFLCIKHYQNSDKPSPGGYLYYSGRGKTAHYLDNNSKRGLKACRIGVFGVKIAEIARNVFKPPLEM